jgi:integrase
MAKMNLIKTVVEGIAPAPGPEKVTLVWDKKLPGFGLRVTHSGVKSYVIQYRPNGSTQSKRITIGRHGKITAEKARAEAERLFAGITLGADPAAETKALKHKPKTMTVDGMLDGFLSDHVKINYKPSTQSEVKGLIKRYIRPRLGPIPLDQLTRGSVKEWHSKITGAKISANRALAHLQRACRYAIENEWMAENPCKNITRNKETSRDRYYTHDELARIGAAMRSLEETGNISRSLADGVRLVALTGLRASEARGLKWANYDSVRKTLRLADAKTGARLVPLFPETVNLLEGMNRQGPWIIAGPTPHMEIGASYMFRTMRALLRHAKVDDASPHTFRHTVATYMAQNGQDVWAISQVGGWKSLSMVQRYVSTHAIGDRHPLPAGHRIAMALAGQQHDVDGN